MTLLAAFLDIAAEWRTVFPQHRTWLRAVRQSLGSLVCLGRRCLTRIIWAHGGQHRGWSAEYFLHSRCQWDPQALFAPILSRGLAHCPGRLVGVAIDDTRLHKTGRCIQQAFYQRDPLWKVKGETEVPLPQGRQVAEVCVSATIGERRIERDRARRCPFWDPSISWIRHP